MELKKIVHFNIDRDYLQLVLFVAELESLRMSTSPGAFKSCNKEGLVRTLWKNHSQEPRVYAPEACGGVKGYTYLILPFRQ